LENMVNTKPQRDEEESTTQSEKIKYITKIYELEFRTYLF